MKRGIFLFICAALVVNGICWGLFYHGMDHGIGIDTQTSLEYAFFSGFGAWLSSTLGLSGIIAALIHHVNCHADGCWRIGKFPVAGGQYKVCGKHHREVTGHPRKLTIEFLRQLHLEHHGRHTQ